MFRDSLYTHATLFDFTFNEQKQHQKRSYMGIQMTQLSFHDLVCVKGPLIWLKVKAPTIIANISIRITGIGKARFV